MLPPLGPEYDDAFNFGSDDRLNGIEFTANPYLAGDAIRYRAWRAGWLDVHNYWGIWSRHRVRALYYVEEPARQYKRKLEVIR